MECRKELISLSPNLYRPLVIGWHHSHVKNHMENIGSFTDSSTNIGYPIIDPQRHGSPPGRRAETHLFPHGKTHLTCTSLLRFPLCATPRSPKRGNEAPKQGACTRQQN